MSGSICKVESQQVASQVILNLRALRHSKDKFSLTDFNEVVTGANELTKVEPKAKAPVVKNDDLEFYRSVAKQHSKKGLEKMIVKLPEKPVILIEESPGTDNAPIRDEVLSPFEDEDDDLVIPAINQQDRVETDEDLEFYREVAKKHAKSKYFSNPVHSKTVKSSPRGRKITPPPPRSDMCGTTIALEDEDPMLAPTGIEQKVEPRRSKLSKKVDPTNVETKKKTRKPKLSYSSSLLVRNRKKTSSSGFTF